MQGASAANARSPLTRRAVVATLYAMAAAAAFGFSFPFNENFGGVALGALLWSGLLALAAVRARSKKQLAACVAVPFGVLFLIHQWWMGEITSLGMPVLVCYLTAWCVLLALVLRALLCARKAIPAALAIPTALVTIEFLRGDLVCGGYAWFYTAHPLVEWSALAQIVDLGGVWLLTALAGLVSGAAVDALCSRTRARWISPVVALSALFAAHFYGTHALAQAPKREPSARFLAVQTNLPMSNKLAWSSQAQIDDFIAFAKLTLSGTSAAATAGTPVDLAIWPETTLPGFGLERESIDTLVTQRLFPGDRFAEGISDLSRRAGVPLVVGSPAFLGLRVEGDLANDAHFAWDDQFNSAYFVDSSGVRGRTDKIFLTPFGETMPIISRWDWLEQRLLDLGAHGMTFDLDAAVAPHCFEIEPTSSPRTKPVRVGVPICFEITVPWASRAIAFPNGTRAADVLLNISNDGWFGPSVGGRLQHLQVARLRAIELRTPVIRAANTGISAWIDSSGSVVRALDARVEGTLLAEPTIDSRTPLAVAVGDAVAWCAALLCVVLFAFVRLKPSGMEAHYGECSRDKVHDAICD